MAAVIARLGYHPNPVAQALSRHRTATLEVVAPLVTRDFYVEVLRGIEIALRETRYSLLIRTIERPGDRERVFSALAAPGQADGAIIVSHAPTPRLVQRFARDRAPVVLVDARHPALPSVSVDHEAAAVAAVRRLSGLGHQRIALVDHDATAFAQGSPDGRRRGFRRALAEAGLTDGGEIVAEFSPAGGEAALHALLGQPEPPTALFVGSDRQAAGIVAAAWRQGVRVPEDLAIVGYNDIDVASYLDLTTMRVPMREMGRLGVQMLLAAINGQTASVPQVVLPAELVVRGSSGAPGGAR
ncbi:MAG: LacI family DNA-binding transcriptional regulator [Thermomicrobiales bacterium]